MRDFDAKTVLQTIAQETQAFRLVGVKPLPSDVPSLLATLAPTQGGKTIKLEITYRERIYPAEIESLAGRMVAARQTGTPVLACPGISLRVAELCKELGVGTLDGTGNCRIGAPGLFILIKGEETASPDTRPAADFFAPRSSRIVRLLLAQPQRGFQVQQLAHEAGVSLALVAKVKKTLLEQALAVEQKRLLYLPDPTKLLEEWGREGLPLYAEKLQVQVDQPAAEAEERLGKACGRMGIEYALTGLSGFRRMELPVYASRASAYYSRRASAFVDGRVKELVAELAWQSDAPAQTTFTLFTPRDDSVFWDTQRIKGLRVVSPLQLYLDLQQERGCAAMATQVLEEVIRPALSDKKTKNADQ